MRLVYLGTSEVAAAILERLAGSAHRPVLVVTRPDRPSGRGRQLASPPVADAARRLGIDCSQPERVNEPEAIAEIEAARPDRLVVCAFGALIKEPLLSLREILNVHPSLLPRWRGAAPIERALMAGDAQTGVSIMRLTAGLDSGPVCAVRSEPIGPDEDYGQLAARLREIGADLLIEVLDAIAAGEAPRFEEQDEQGVTYAEKISAADRLLDCAQPPRRVALTVRALHPHIGARLRLAGGEPLGVLRVALQGAPELPAGIAPGQLFASDGRLAVACAGGSLELLEVRPAGGKPMDGAAYARGHSLESR